MRHKNNRRLYFHDNISLKLINHKPEIRFRVVRESTRKVMRYKITKEFKKNELIKSIKKKMVKNL